MTYKTASHCFYTKISAWPKDCQRIPERIRSNYPPNAVSVIWRFGMRFVRYQRDSRLGGLMKTQNFINGTDHTHYNQNATQNNRAGSFFVVRDRNNERRGKKPRNLYAVKSCNRRCGDRRKETAV